MTEPARQIGPERMGGRRRRSCGTSASAARLGMTAGTLGHKRVTLDVDAAPAAGYELQGVRDGRPRRDAAGRDDGSGRGDRCGGRRDSDKEIRAPVVVVEVLSGSPEARDHGFKRWAYATIPSLKHYVLIAQDRAEAEVATSDGAVWLDKLSRWASVRPFWPCLACWKEQGRLREPASGEISVHMIRSFWPRCSYLVTPVAHPVVMRNPVTGRWRSAKCRRELLGAYGSRGIEQCAPLMNDGWERMN